MPHSWSRSSLILVEMLLMMWLLGPEGQRKRTRGCKFFCFLFFSLSACFFSKCWVNGQAGSSSADCYCVGTGPLFITKLFILYIIHGLRPEGFELSNELIWNRKPYVTCFYLLEEHFYISWYAVLKYITYGYVIWLYMTVFNKKLFFKSSTAESNFFFSVKMER